MEGVKEWCIRVVGILILAVMCEGILPSGDVKKYVRILTGLILTIFIANPVADGFKTDFFIDENEQTVDFEAEKMEEKERENVLRLYKANLEKKMNEDLSSVIDNCEFEFQIEVESGNMSEFGKIKGVIITVLTKEEIYVNDVVERLLSEKYGISTKNIAVNYRIG
ncbi:MAG: hypothetical protein E7415_02680 [Ruminococcaceae bacterium]|nr:hypothetical protein [Oscillospiraceae bacterium]